MEITLTKFLTLLVYPYSLAIICLATGMVLFALGQKRGAYGGFISSFVLLWLSGSSFVADFLLESLENDFAAIPVEESLSADAIVILSGGVGLPLPPRIMPDLNGSADRVYYAAMLYKAKKAPKIIVTGGNVYPIENVKGEAWYTIKLLQDWGVDEKDILIEEKSRTTYENAVETKALMQQHGIRSILLVTSAFHMPRAYQTFAALGMSVIPTPSDFNVVDMHVPLLVQLVPDASQMGKTQTAIKEYLGIIAYQMRGYIN